jgi:hypothetical protein
MRDLKGPNPKSPAAPLAGGASARRDQSGHAARARRAARQCAARVGREEGARAGRLQGPAAARGGLAGGRGQARGASERGSALTRTHAAHATRGRSVRVESGTQRGKHGRAQAQAQAQYKQEEGKRDKARGTALAALSSV